MKNLILFILLLAPPNFASNTDDVAYFKLHQATGLYEQFVYKKCDFGRKKALSLLNSINTNFLNKDIKSKVLQLKSWISKKPAPSITEIESFRLSIHELQERLKLHHDNKWHDEIVDECQFTQIRGRIHP